ncbi:hypothetical protein J5N97_028766 [Dioscorea zingiberensis]|uniref:PHD-type domain-containing protein n=1 Tax=Dioscorea zingiberensis TaxID=325984 RepID=A0A9D5BZS0_9LILI|nr:hypothetical protein J5N97_028766 [Dioscorea zingiberensis]
MIGNRPLLTYKRRRFPSSLQPSHDIKTSDSCLKSPSKISSRQSSPKSETNSKSRKLNGDCVYCFKCGTFDVNENLLDCSSCSATYHLRCIDPPLKFPQEKWDCSACGRKCDLEDSMQLPDQDKTRKEKKLEESSSGHMQLHSDIVLPIREHAEENSRQGVFSCVEASANNIAHSIQMNHPCMNSISECRITCNGGPSKFQSTNLDIVRKFPECSKLSGEKSNSGCPNGSVLESKNLGSRVQENDGHVKEISPTPLITYRTRRVKKKQDGGNIVTERNLKAENKRCSSTNLSTHVLRDSSKNEGPSQSCNFSAQSTTAAVVIELSPLHRIQRDETPNLEKGSGPNSALRGGFSGTKINRTGNSCEKLDIRSAQGPNLSHQSHLEHIPENKSNKFKAVPTTGTTENLNLLDANNQSTSGNSNASLREELGNKLSVTVCNSEKLAIPCDVSAESESLGLSVVPPASTCLNNVEPNQSSQCAPHKDILESQSSSTPNCTTVLLDEGSRGKGKGLEWLETIDKAFSNSKKDRMGSSDQVFEEERGGNRSSIVRLGGTIGRQASNGVGSPLTPVSLFAESLHGQGSSKQFASEMVASGIRFSLTKSDEHSSQKQQQEEAPKSSLRANFIDLSLPLNPKASFNSNKDLRNVPSSSFCCIKDDAHMQNKMVPWLTIDENSSLSRQKQIVESVITGTQMLQERQDSLLEKFRIYSIDWSEEELDFLWIGVRRHGLDNWNTILSDPKLCFLESRTALDLAERWELEQSKLFHGSSSQPVTLSRPSITHTPVMNDALTKSAAGKQYSSWSHGCSDFQRPATETKLSLGDVYLQKESMPKRNLYSGMGLTSPLTNGTPSAGSSLLGSLSKSSMYSWAGNSNQRLVRVQNTRNAWEQQMNSQQNIREVSANEHQLAGPQASNSNLPHWLKEIFDMPPGISANAHSGSFLNGELQTNAPYLSTNDPSALLKDPRGRGILKIRGMTSNSNVSSLRMPDVLASASEPQIGTKFSLLPTLGQASIPLPADNAALDQAKICNLGKKNTVPISPSELVVIESDASSEETISDDQNSRL